MAGLLRSGKSWYVEVGSGEVRSGKAGKARYGMARHGTVWSGFVRYGETWRVMAGKVRCVSAW